MPGAASLAAGQYYAHPRNHFWPIMGRLLGAGPELPYAKRVRRLKSSGIALWDVLESCVRPGSLDADIEEGSIAVNDFAGFFDAHPRIGAVFFNGAKAESAYRRHVLEPMPAPMYHGPLPAAAGALPALRLPSTSPAHAALSFDRKLSVWQVLRR